MHDDVNVEIVPLHLSGSVSSWSPNDGHQVEESWRIDFAHDKPERAGARDHAGGQQN